MKRVVKRPVTSSQAHVKLFHKRLQRRVSRKRVENSWANVWGMTRAEAVQLVKIKAPMSWKVEAELLEQKRAEKRGVSS